MSVRQKEGLQQAIKKLNSSKIDINMYSSLCRVFQVYNDLNNFFKIENIENLTTSKLIKSIAYTFEKSLELEDLCNIYPMYIREHYHFMIAGNIVSQNITIIENLNAKECIKKNEWMRSEKKYLEEMYLYLRENKPYPFDKNILITQENISTNNIAFILNKKAYTLNYYLKSLKDKVNSKNFISIENLIINELIKELNYE